MNRHIHTAVTDGRQLSDFNIIRILIVRYIRKAKLQLKFSRCLISVQWTTTVAANMTNSITVVRTLNMLIAFSRHRFSIVRLEICVIVSCTFFYQNLIFVVLNLCFCILV